MKKEVVGSDFARLLGIHWSCPMNLTRAQAADIEAEQASRGTRSH